ncbi:HTTM domain-containing protein, partial [Streptomyces sp. DSM 41528]|nr:HTTM domain-containing protein [Streptomyces sp. DSM 41528]
NVLLVIMIGEHAGIALLLGLPFFSMAMIAADAVFLPTAFLVWLGGRAALGRQRLLGRLPRRWRPAGDGGPPGVPTARPAPEGRGGTGEAPPHGGGGGHTLVG